MLIYLGQGKRFYGEKPVKVYPRTCWEFQAVVKGSISLVRPDGPDVLRESHLWIFPPSHRHGWFGEKERSAEIVVFHFILAPAPLQTLVEKEGFLAIPLDAAQCRRLKFLADQAARYWRHPVVGMTICFEHILMELSLLALEAAPGAAEVFDTSRQRVDAAIKWFVERMAECPTLEAISAAVGSSPAHLRRMFHEVLQTSPKQVLDQLRFQRAMQMMSDSTIKLDAIGEACGFGSGSAFSRAFKIKYGTAPRSWRDLYVG